jgi:hypothetical protein
VVSVSYYYTIAWRFRIEKSGLEIVKVTNEKLKTELPAKTKQRRVLEKDLVEVNVAAVRAKGADPARAQEGRRIPQSAGTHLIRETAPAE